MEIKVTKVDAILLAFKAIKFLQAMQKGESTEKRNKLVAEVLPDTPEDDVARVAKEMPNIDPDFVQKLIVAAGAFVKVILK